MIKPFPCLLFFLIFACNLPTKANETATKVDSHLIPSDHDMMGEDYAREQISELLKGKGQPFTWDTLIKGQATAITMAESILFEKFSKEWYC